MNIPLRSRFDDHLSRKFFHLLIGTIVAYLFANTFTRLQSLVILAVFLVVLVPAEILRLRIPALNKFILKIYGPLMRENERNQPSAQLYFALGLAWAVGFLPRPIAIQAILTLAWMDPCAGVFGVRFGRISWNSFLKKFFVDSRHLPISLGAKTLEGSFAGFLAAFLAGLVAWTGPWAAFATTTGLLWPGPWTIFVLSAVGGLAAMFAEAWPTQWDDNAVIPFWTGLVVWATAQMLSVPLIF